MKDPYLLEIDSYLDSVERFAAPVHKRAYRTVDSPAMAQRLKSMAVVAAIFCFAAFIPWFG